jgi:hypothetical protein
MEEVVVGIDSLLTLGPLAASISLLKFEHCAERLSEIFLS